MSASAVFLQNPDALLFPLWGFSILC